MFRTTEKNSAAVDINCDSKGEVNNSTEETGNNTRVLRSGSQHLRVHPTSLTQTNSSVTVLTTPTVTMSSPNTTTTNASATSGASTSQASNQPPAPATKIVNMSNSVREFSGNDPSFTAREYVELCEATMHQCGIVVLLLVKLVINLLRQLQKS